MMNSINYTNDSEKLVALLDGELRKEEAGNFFYSLANNNELQEELHEMIDMKNMFRGTVNSAPPHLHSAVLKSTGLSGRKTGALVPFISFLGTILSSKLFIALASLAAGTLITFYASDYNKQNMETVDEPAITQNSIPIIVNIASEEKFQSPDKNYPNEISAGQSSVSNSHTSNELMTENFGSIINSSLNFESNSDFENTISVRKLNSSQNTTMNITPSSIALNSMDPEFSLLTEQKNEDSRGFIFLLRNFSTLSSSPDLNIPPPNTPLINNIALAMLYEINDFNSLGLEFGQESFMQEYELIETWGSREYEQNFIGFWGGIAYRHQFGYIFPNSRFIPYTKGFFGATSQGPLVKGEFGLNFIASENVDMFLGIEGTGFFYSLKDKLYSTDKYGLSYGMAFKF